MAVPEPSNTTARPQSGAFASSLYNERYTAECFANSSAIADPNLDDYARVVILFSAIWALCVGAAFWGAL
jgi:hypothetical protein